jgi:phosphoesterase RecJ-like protein
VLSQVVELIESKSHFGITTHVRPDGDGIGSSLGLYWLLRSLGKTAEVFVKDDIPRAYLRLPGAQDIKRVQRVDREFDAVFVIECSDLDRPEIHGLEAQFIVNIDHHATSQHFGNLNWIDATASAVGEMIYNLCKATGGKVTKEIAECIYLALITDTGSFHFPNTTDRTLKVASELVKAGVRPAEISQTVYNSYPWSRIELMRRVLSSVKRDATGKVAALRQTLEMKLESGSIDGDNNGFVNIPLTAEDVLAVVYMREVRSGLFRVSLRSKGDVDVSSIAESHGGGGHKNAAGCRVEGDWDDLESRLMSELSEAVLRAERALEDTITPDIDRTAA